MLLKLARDNSDVLKTPEPFVTLDEFAPASINFTLYAYIGDITQTGSVRTQLSMMILTAFAEAGIVRSLPKASVGDWRDRPLCRSLFFLGRDVCFWM